MYQSPTGRESKYRYVYESGERCRQRDVVLFEGEKWLVSRGNGTNKQNPFVWIINSAEKQHDVCISELEFVCTEDNMTPRTRALFPFEFDGPYGENVRRQIEAAADAGNDAANDDDANHDGADDDEADDDDDRRSCSSGAAQETESASSDKDVKDKKGVDEEKDVEIDDLVDALARLGVSEKTRDAVRKEARRR